MTVHAVPLKYLVGINERGLPEDTDPDRQIRYVDISSVGRGDLVAMPNEMRFADAPSRARRLVKPGDTIVSTVRTYLRAVWPVSGATDDLVVSTGFAVLTPRSVDPAYFSWWVRSDVFIEEVVARSVGVSYPAINATELGELPVRIPGAEEQRAIAEFLDTESARIDALITKKRRMISLLIERSVTGQIELVTGRVGGGPLRASGLEWLGDIPRHWSVERLKHLARPESGHTPSRSRPELWEDCTVPWITLNDLGHLAANEFITETVNLISTAGLAASSARVLPAGTVVLSRDATIGRVGIMSCPMATSQHFVDWVCGPRLNPRFLWLLFRTAMQGHFDSLTDGATLRTIGMPDVLAFSVPLPPESEQEVIVKNAEARRIRAHATTAALRRQIELLQEHRQALITAAVTGQLEVPGVAA